MNYIVKKVNDDNYLTKNTHGQFTFTPNKAKAEEFPSESKANNVIKSNFSKVMLKMMKVIPNEESSNIEDNNTYNIDIDIEDEKLICESEDFDWEDFARKEHIFYNQIEKAKLRQSQNVSQKDLEISDYFHFIENITKQEIIDMPEYEKTELILRIHYAAEARRKAKISRDMLGTYSNADHSNIKKGLMVTQARRLTHGVYHPRIIKDVKSELEKASLDSVLAKTSIEYKVYADKVNTVSFGEFSVIIKQGKIFFFAQEIIRAFGYASNATSFLKARGITPSLLTVDEKIQPMLYIKIDDVDTISSRTKINNPEELVRELHNAVDEYGMVGR